MNKGGRLAGSCERPHLLLLLLLVLVGVLVEPPHGLTLVVEGPAGLALVGAGPDHRAALDEVGQGLISSTPKQEEREATGQSLRQARGACESRRGL